MRVNFHFICSNFQEYSLVFVYRRKGAFLFNVNDILDQDDEIESADDDEPNPPPILPFKKRINEPKCQKCGKSFKTVSSRNFHVKTSHEAAMVFKCGSCKGTKAMRYLKNLRDHVIKSHGRQLTAKEKKAVVLRAKKETVVKRMFLNNFESLRNHVK